MWLQDEVARKKRVTSQEEDRGEGETEDGRGGAGGWVERVGRRREKDITMQSAPSAQRLRCGLAPSSQSQPDPHIALIYLERG